MTNHEGCVRGFHWFQKAWYRRNDPERREIMIGMYHPEGGTSGEMAIRWEYLSSRWIPQLQAYHDSWSALALFKDLIDELAKYDSQNPTEETIVEILRTLGFRDFTNYHDPEAFPKQGMTYTAHHNPSNEDWVIIGIDPKGNRVCAAGYPPSIAYLSDLSRIEERAPITDEEKKYRDKEFGLHGWN